MPRPVRRKVVALAAASVPMLAFAADQLFDIRPGEWKYTMGVDLGSETDTRTATSCLTAEDIRGVRVLQVGSADARSCTAEVTHQSSRLIEGTILCRDERRTTRLQVRLEASSPTRFSGTVQAAGTDGRAEMKLTAEWVGAECRDVDEDEGDWNED